MKKSKFFRQGIKKSVALLIIVLQIIAMFTGCLTARAATTQGADVSRLINVVYDDSNSMIMDKSYSWSEAKYSLEILSAMMQEGDEMNVYFMSDYYLNRPTITVKGGSENVKQSNIQKIHNTRTHTGGTFFESIEKAYANLKSKGASYDERHLVVLTDGQLFNDVNEGSEDKALKDQFANAKADGIKVVYLAIGEEAIKPQQDEANGIYVYQATPGNKSILNKVTEMCKRIFQRPDHPTSGNTLNLKVPVSEIVIFAQGDATKIGDIKGANRSISTSSFTDNDWDKASLDPNNSQIKGKGNIVVAKGLSGAVATFTPASGDYIPEGTYNLDITAETYTVYYKPSLDVKLKILDKDGNEVKDGSEVDKGEFKADYYLTYPKGHAKHGEQLSLSDLGINPTYTLEIKKDGAVVETTEGPGPKNINLDEGKAEITATAKYLTYISTDSSIGLVVDDFEEYPLNVEVTPAKKEYMLSELEKDKDGFKVKVSVKDGPALTPELWKNAKLTLTAEGLDFYEAVKNNDYTFTVRPKAKDGDYKKTASGDIPFKAGVTIQIPNSKDIYKGTGNATVNIYNDVVPNEKDGGFKITVTDKTSDIKSDNFNGASPAVKVKITWNGKPLTKAQHAALKLKAVMEEDFKVKDANGKELSLIEISEIKLDPYKEGEDTTATIKFKSNGDAETQRKNLAKYDDFVITATLEMVGVKSEAKQEDSLDVSKVLSPAEILLIVIIIAAILFFICGYIIFKKWLPFKVNYFIKKTSFRKEYLYKSPLALITALIPFAPVESRVVIRSEMRDMTPCTVAMHLRARDKGQTAYLVNPVELYKDGQTYVDASKAQLDRYTKQNSKNAGSSKKAKPPKVAVRLKSSSVRKRGELIITFTRNNGPKRKKK